MKLSNYKTTAVGCLGAILTVVVPMLQGGAINAKDMITAAAIAAISFLAKDFDTTGAGQTASKG